MTEHRQLSAEGIKVTAPRDIGPAPDLRWLPIDRLVIDDSYQRPIAFAGRRNINAIANAFDWRRFSPVIVAPVEGGSYAIVDGQHRTTAAAAIGITSVPCA